ncbi:MAG TPA: DUF3999 domain-containing protein [Steroidobacter sp.]|nr:DUF3999 domain-containing protein [Steroidobacter sp.]
MKLANTVDSALRLTGVLALVLASASAALAAAPKMDDYARGAVIEAIGRPIVELALPDEAYQSVARADLRDVRVFNADGAPVPHALCAARDSEEPTITEHPAPVFELRDVSGADGEGARIEVQTDGTRIDVHTGARGSTSRPERIHIIDARSIKRPLRAIRFDWSSADQASQAKVRIEASDDLDRWDTVVAGGALIRASTGSQELRRERIELPIREYQYLRVQRVDGGPALGIAGVIAEAVDPAEETEPSWFAPAVIQGETPTELRLDAGRLAPVQFARLRLPQENSSVRATLQSRSDEDAPWRDRWSGEAWSVARGAERRESAPARFQATTDRYWRVLLPKEAEGAPLPAIELGYRPDRVRFLAQGAGPYVLAFGSRRAAPAAPSGCDDLLADVSAGERDQMTAEGRVQQLRTLGGEAAYKPPPRQTPLRTMALWGVLILGVGLLAAMALSLLKRLGEDRERAEDGKG